MLSRDCPSVTNGKPSALAKMPFGTCTGLLALVGSGVQIGLIWRAAARGVLPRAGRLGEAAVWSLHAAAGC